MTHVECWSAQECFCHGPGSKLLKPIQTDFKSAKKGNAVNAWLIRFFSSSVWIEPRCAPPPSREQYASASLKRRGAAAVVVSFTGDTSAYSSPSDDPPPCHETVAQQTPRAVWYLEWEGKGAACVSGERYRRLYPSKHATGPHLHTSTEPQHRRFAENNVGFARCA